MTERLITDQTEITGLPRLIGSSLCRERETALLTDRAVQFASVKTFVFYDSLLFLGGISTEPVRAWESKILGFLETRYLKDLDRIDGKPMEFEWKMFPRIRYIADPQRDSKDDD